MDLSRDKQPWYVGGLAFECVLCGRCCEGPEEGYVWTTREEIARIAQYLGISEDEMRQRYIRRIGKRYSLVERRGNKDCIFLQCDLDGNKTCRIYPVRPKQCTSWPFWDSNLRTPEGWAFAQSRCPGINRGRIYSCEEIESKRRSTSE